jgi:hypothetical protein
VIPMRERPFPSKFFLVERAPSWIWRAPRALARPGLNLAASLLLATAFAISHVARAEVHVSGDRKAMTLVAKEASVQEVLTALRETFWFNLESGAPLDKTVTGNFRGSLDEVVASLLFLKDYNYVYSRSARPPMLRIIGVGQDSTAMEGLSSGVGDPTLNAPPQLQPEFAEEPPPPAAPAPPRHRER